MRLDVTPLGGAGLTVAQVAGAIVEYLEGGVGDPGGADRGDVRQHLSRCRPRSAL
jgi:hypothetical protein